MARIIDYADVLPTLENQGFASLYPQSGAFGFAGARPLFHRGWIGAADSTIRPQALDLVRQAKGQLESTLTRAVTKFWTTHLRQPLWLMPKSHWAYELQFGNALWLRGALTEIGIDAELLARRSDGAAICFDPNDAATFTGFLLAMLTHLASSDFQLAWPGTPILCAVHHHQQLWWSTSDANLAECLNATSLE